MKKIKLFELGTWDRLQNFLYFHEGLLYFFSDSLLLQMWSNGTEGHLYYNDMSTLTSAIGQISPSTASGYFVSTIRCPDYVQRSEHPSLFAKLCDWKIIFTF